MANANRKFVLDLVALRCLAREIAPSKDIRFYLNGVHVMPHPEGTMYSVTDGSMAARYLDRSKSFGSWDDNKIDREAIIDVETLRALPRLGKKHTSADRFAVCEWIENGKIRIGDTIAQTIDGKFPDISRIMPTGARNGVAAWINMEFVASANKAYRELYNTSTAYCMPISFNGEDATALMSENDFVAVIMPLRRPEFPHEGAPHWANFETSNKTPETKQAPQPELIDAVATMAKPENRSSSHAAARCAHLLGIAKYYAELARTKRPDEDIYDEIDRCKKHRVKSLRYAMRAGAVFHTQNAGYWRKRPLHTTFLGVKTLHADDLKKRPTYLPPIVSAPHPDMLRKWKLQFSEDRKCWPLFGLVHTGTGLQPKGYIQGFASTMGMASAMAVVNRIETHVQIQRFEASAEFLSTLTAEQVTA